MIEELRVLALRLGCDMNDLLLLAAHDLLLKVGRPTHAEVDEELRHRVIPADTIDGRRLTNRGNGGAGPEPSTNT